MPKGPIFNLYSAIGNVKGLISIPHSGLHIPEECISYLSPQPRELMEDVDFAVHELIDIQKLNNQGISVLVSLIHRTAIDLNRSRQDCVLHWKLNTKGKKIVFNLPEEQEQEKIRLKYYDPYYEILKTHFLGNNTEKDFPFIDLHSMPSRPTDYHLRINPHQDSERPKFCLSDQHGKTCQSSFILKMQELLSKHYEPVKINNPYVGGHITQWAGTFAKRQNIQIEINRALYMDEEHKNLIDAHIDLKENLTQSLLDFFAWFENHNEKLP